jgi:hypothetical protein
VILGLPPARRGIRRDRPDVPRSAPALCDDATLQQPGVGQTTELDPHAVVVAADAFRELLRRRRTRKARKRREEFRSQWESQNVFVDLDARVHRPGPPIRMAQTRHRRAAMPAP